MRILSTCYVLALKVHSSLTSDFPNSVQKQMMDLLEGWLRHKSDMVNFEAARVICEIKNVTPAQLVRPVARRFFPFSFRQV